MEHLIDKFYFLDDRFQKDRCQTRIFMPYVIKDRVFGDLGSVTKHLGHLVTGP